MAKGPTLCIGAREGSPLNIFVRLFLLRQSVAIGDVRRVIEPTQLEDWANVGLLEINGSGYRFS